MASRRRRSVLVRVIWALMLLLACSSQDAAERLGQSQQALVNLQVFVRDEGASEGNVVKPRIYVRNNDAVPLANFSVHYYFTINTGKTPVVEDWYTPNSSVALQQVQGTLYRAVYNHAGFTLQPGAVTPNTSGDVVGLHYTDWSSWTKSDDWSYLGVGSNFISTTRIVVVDSTGAVVFGTPPPGVPGGGSGGAGGSAGTGGSAGAGGSAGTGGAAGTGTTVTVTLPALLSQTNIAVAAHDRLLIRDRGFIRYPDETTNLPPISNNGSAETNIGVDSKVGTIYSRAAVTLRGTNQAGAGVQGDVNSMGTVTRQNNHFVSGAIRASTAIDFRNRTQTFQIPTIPTGTINLNSGQTVVLQPGTHQGYNLNSGATLRLAAGRHYMPSLNVNAAATLHVLNGNAPVEVFLNGSLTFNGTLQEDGTGDAHGNFRVVGLGQSPVNVLSRFIGTILAPRSFINIARTNQPHEGSFFGRTVEVAADAKIHFVPFRSSMIVSVTTNKSTVCKNEPIEVTAVVRPLNDGDPRQPFTTINGKPGTTATLQFPTQGTYLVVVVAFQDGVTQSREIQVQVNNCESGFPRIVAAPDIQPYTTQLTVDNAELFSGATYNWTFGDGSSESTPYPSVGHDYSASLPHDRDFQFDVTLTVTRAGQPNVSVKKPLYFRNMYAEMARRGFVRPLVRAPQRFQKIDKEFVGTYNVRNVEPNPITITERWTERHFCDGDREPELVNESAVTVGRDWTLPRTIPARSAVDLTLVLQRVDFGSDVCGVTEYLAGRTQNDNLDIRISASFETREPGPFGYEITDPESLTVLRQVVNDGLVPNTDEFSHSELENLMLQRRISSLPVVSSPVSGALACVSGGTAADCLGQFCDPEQNTSPPVPNISCQRTDRVRVVPGLVRNARKGDLLLVPGCEQLGQILRKVNPPQGYVHEGIMTRNYVEVAHSIAVQGRVMRGAAEEQEINEDLLRFEWPGAIVETTSSAFGECPGQDFTNPDQRPECLTDLVDPEGFLHNQGGFSPKALKCRNEMQQLHPLVIRPAPRLTFNGPRFTPEEMAVTRALLHQAGDFARTQHLQTHYRLFAYTQGAISFDTAFDTPASSGMGAGFSASHSSMFVWFALKSTPGITLEGTTNEQYLRCNPITDPTCDPTSPPNEEQDGARIRDGSTQTTDGLYLYTEDERVAGLHEVRRQVIEGVYDQVIDACPVCPEFSFSAAEAAADQLANCFALDDCSVPRVIFLDANGNEVPQQQSVRQVYTGDKWKTPGEGFTISPDHFLFWDSPFYGDWEQMHFMSATYMPIYEWVEADTTQVGIVPVHVTLKANGEDVEGANVSVAGQDGFSDTDGNVTFVSVTAGNHQVDGTFGSLFASAPVTVVAGMTSPVVELQLSDEIPEPPDAFIVQRTVSVTGSIDVTDVDSDSGNETATFSFSASCVVDTFDRNDTFATASGGSNFCVDNEVSVQVSGSCQLLNQDDCLLPENQGTDCVPDETIKFTARLVVEEEDECWTDDRDCGSFGDVDGFDRYERTEQFNLPAKCDTTNCPTLAISIPRGQQSCDGPASDEAFADATLSFSNMTDIVQYGSEAALSMVVTRRDGTVTVPVVTPIRRQCTFNSAQPGPGTITVVTPVPPPPPDPAPPAELPEICQDGFRARVSYACELQADLHTVHWTDILTIDQTATCDPVSPTNPVLQTITQQQVHVLPQTTGPFITLPATTATLNDPLIIDPDGGGPIPPFVATPHPTAVATLSAGAINTIGPITGTFPDVQPDMNRHLTFTGGIHIVDDDGFLESDDIGDFDLFGECFVDPFDSFDSFSTSFCVDDEVTVQISVGCQLSFAGVDPNDPSDDLRHVHVFTTATMFEEATCNSTDEDGVREREVLAPPCDESGPCRVLSLNSTTADPNVTESEVLVLKNDDEGGDRADIHVTFTNRPD